jgi:hypothetical protein
VTFPFEPASADDPLDALDDPLDDPDEEPDVDPLDDPDVEPDDDPLDDPDVESDPPAGPAFVGAEELQPATPISIAAPTQPPTHARIPIDSPSRRPRDSTPENASLPLQFQRKARKCPRKTPDRVTRDRIADFSTMARRTESTRWCKRER